MSDSTSFEQLSAGVQRWIYHQRWPSLRAIQEAAIPPILEKASDILITAPTAGGKTEAAFLPIVSDIERRPPAAGYAALCLVPLKALINDQAHRLEPLCEFAGTAVTPWHGDIAQSRKRSSWERSQGLLMITPESLESLLINRTAETCQRLANINYVVIDEFHAFIGRDRGVQLISQLARIESLIERTLPRVALSATIGDPEMALDALRPDRSFPRRHLNSEGDGGQLQLVVKGFPEPVHDNDPTVAEQQAEELFQRLRGGRHLVFANSRQSVEVISSRLQQLCDESHVPHEFFPHHGSLSKDIRHEAEARLKDGRWPASVVATSTLELGIDVGDVESVAQLGAPANVSSLRQRLGRSGRRGSPAVLRSLVAIHTLDTDPNPAAALELELFQTAAVIELLLERWIEPPSSQNYHLSTLVQQILALIAQRGGITASFAYFILCQRGPWPHIQPDHFARVLQAMGAADLLDQLPNGELVVGLEGEKRVSHYQFYTAFTTPEEFRLLCNGRSIGTLPVDSPLMENMRIIFGGRRWQVLHIDRENRVVDLTPSRGGSVPTFGGEGAPVHRRIREKMFELYLQTTPPRYIAADALTAFDRAQAYFAHHGLGQRTGVVHGGGYYWPIWSSEPVINAIRLAGTAEGVAINSFAGIVEIDGIADFTTIADVLLDALTQHDAYELASVVGPLPLGKFDEYLSDELLIEAFAADLIDVNGAKAYIDAVLRSA